MKYFQCDYAQGAHPEILKKMQETNLESTEGYGLDAFCQEAREKILKACGSPDADVHFLVGGTQTNMTVIAAALKPYQGALAADAGHIATHETGAIEAAGHKVLTLPSKDGKITADQVESYIREHEESDVMEHTVQPGLVYISHPTECGSLYTKQELSRLSEVCRRFGKILFLDGARMGYGLTSEASDVTLEDIASLCDVFYIGGTKCGALFGEAVVIVNQSLKRDFRYMIKQRGGMLAKGRLLGIQFDVLFENDRYYHICRSANEKAMKIRAAFEEEGIPMWGDSRTNQQFPILTKAQMGYFSSKYVYEVWEKYDEERTVVRFCTSWATTDADVQELITDIHQMKQHLTHTLHK